MSRNRLSFFGGIAILIMFAAASCSRPAENAQQTQPSPAVAPAVPDTPAPAAAPDKRLSEEPKRVNEEPVRPAAPRHSTASTVTPPTPIVEAAPPAPPAPAPTPVPPPLPQVSAPIYIADAAPPAPEPTTKQVTIPAGTQIYVRTIDSISSDKNHAGETFRASVDTAIVVDNQTIIPKRADVVLKLTDVESAGKLKGTSQLKVQLDRIVVGKKSYDVVSNTYEQTGESEGKKAARNVGVGAAVGAVLGGILGGGKGAVIGAGAGGGGGAVISKGEQMRLDSETQLIFRLENPLEITLTTAPPTARFSTASGSSGPANLAPPPDRPDQSASSRSSSNSNNNDLSGTWTVTTDGAQGSSLQLVIRQNGNNLRGSISNPNGYGTIPIQGSVNGNYVNFSFQGQSQYGSNGQQIQYSGAVQGDSMQGTVMLPAASNNGYGGVGGYPGGGRNRRGAGTGGTIQARWNAQRN
jgi:hypothetical protein